MQNLAELLSELESEPKWARAIARRLATELLSQESSAPPGATCANTQSAASGGDGSALAITGLMARQWLTLRAEYEKRASTPMTPVQDVRHLESVLDALFYSDGLPRSVIGGSASQPLPSDEPQRNWPGESSDPTRRSESYAHTPTAIRTDLNALLVTVAELLSGLLARSESEIPSDVYAVLVQVRELHRQMHQVLCR